MYYFIPSWYGSERFWHRDIIPWYHAMSRLEFDDAIHQIRIFQTEEREVQLLLLAYMPHARYFLHRQDIFEAAYYSVFDAIQGIETREMRNLQLKDLDWPDDCEFIYTPFLILVRRQGRLYAHVEFGIEGFISCIRFYEGDQLERLSIFDDRGFVSSNLYYQEGRPAYQDFLDEAGDWRVRFAFEDGRVEVNPAYAEDFDQLAYPGMMDLILEKLGACLQKEAGSDSSLVLSAHPAHNEAFLKILPEKMSKIVSFFFERNHQDDLASTENLLAAADLVLADRMGLQDRLQSLFPQQAAKIHQISPFDTRLQLGKSQRRRETKLYYQINLDEPLNDYAIFKVLFYLAQHPDMELTIGVYNAWQEGIQKVADKVDELIAAYLKRQDFIKSYQRSEQAENALLENQEEAYRFTIKNMTDELSLIQELEYTRVIIDMSQEPNLYTQIAGISAGIPQINLTASDYVSHLENGYILSEIAELPTALDYYLNGLKNWNQSLIYSIEKIRENTGAELISKWENWLREGGDPAWQTS